MQPQFNPDLAPWEPISPNNVAGKGRSLEAAFLGGRRTLEDIVAVLNERGPRNPAGGDVWTEDAFLAEMRRLGA